MALINCDECQNEISDKAAACPKCGAPIASHRDFSNVGTTLTTTQLTSKRLKLHTIGATVLTIFGVLWWINIGNHFGAPAGPVLLTFGGAGWFMVTRFRIWWHHK